MTVNIIILVCITMTLNIAHANGTIKCRDVFKPNSPSLVEKFQKSIRKAEQERKARKQEKLSKEREYELLVERSITDIDELIKYLQKEKYLQIPASSRNILPDKLQELFDDIGFLLALKGKKHDNRASRRAYITDMVLEMLDNKGIKVETISDYIQAYRSGNRGEDIPGIYFDPSKEANKFFQYVDTINAFRYQTYYTTIRSSGIFGSTQWYEKMEGPTALGVEFNSGKKNATYVDQSDNLDKQFIIYWIKTNKQ